jgi:hypothetical protein
MHIENESISTYILLNGIIVPENISLSDNIELQPADTSHLDFSTAISTSSRPDDIAVIAAFIPRITSQFHIFSTTPKESLFHAWNSSWDAFLLSALFHTEIGFNLQSDVSAEKIGTGSNLHATNLYMYGIHNTKPYKLTNNDTEWIASNFKVARKLLDNDRFQTAVHCLASYRWHSLPRIKLAVLWAGIEGIFGASTEIRFRISLYIAKFLYLNDVEMQKENFEAIKKLYDSRSAAVHGSKIKGDINVEVEKTATILQNILIKCVSNKSIPNEKELVP